MEFEKGEVENVKQLTLFLKRCVKNANKEKKEKLCSLIPIMKSPIKSNRRISLSRDAPFSWLCSVCSTSVSIHAPRVGCDFAARLSLARAICFNPRTPGGVRQGCCVVFFHIPEFQSTHPGWGATKVKRIYSANKLVSIHAPRVGCDLRMKLSSGSISGFNPRTPGGVRQ